jgi:hypothetical protein
LAGLNNSGLQMTYLENFIDTRHFFFLNPCGWVRMGKTQSRIAASSSASIYKDDDAISSATQ